MSDTLDRLKTALADRYAIERELGRGGMAVVYLARDLKHERMVALKLLRPELAATVGAERFLREIRIAAQLNHPHILMLIDSGEVNDSLYYVMPFVEGESLRDKLTRERELPISDAVRILRDVVDALAMAHSHGVIHRDIKPDNVMLSGRHAMVADFGVAKALSQAKGPSDLTTAGVALGTPAYMSPEQAVADEQVDHRSDIYAVGALAYELLTGRPPFLGTTAQMVLAAHVADPPDPVTKYRENVSPPLELLVLRCLEKKPADRWQSAEELLAQLEAVVTPSGGMTPTTTRPVATAAGRKRKRPVWGVVAILTAAATVVLLGGLWLVPKILGPSAAVANATLPRLVVLPFENLGAPEDEYFADGITDEITSRMVRVSGLVVIDRAAAVQYKDTEKTTSQIAAELDADYLLAGTIRWSKAAGAESRVRVSPRLVRGSDETQMWAEPFQAELTDVWGLQADVAEMVAQALDVSLGSGEREEMRALPTDNVEAYEHYLRGNVISNDRWGHPEELGEAFAHYEAAVELDPGFALAYAKLSLAGAATDVSREERLALRREYAEEALRLDPDLPEGHAALGLYYLRCCRDFAKANAEFDLALAKKPNDPDVIYLSAGSHGRGGDFERAAALFAKASDLNPLNGVPPLMAKQMYQLLREYDLAERYHERWATAYSGAMELQPSFLGVRYVYKAEIMLKRDGNVDAVREMFEQAQEPTELDYWELVTFLDKPYGRVMCVQDIDACREGLGQADFRIEGFPDVDWNMIMADLHNWAGNESTSRAYYDSAATAAAIERDMQLRGGGFLVAQGTHQYEGYAAYIAAVRGDTAEALRHVERHLEARLTLIDKYTAVFQTFFPTAESYMMVGEVEAALDQLEFWLSRPSYLSVALLRVDPFWDPVRDDPRFEALLERYGG